MNEPIFFALNSKRLYLWEDISYLFLNFCFLSRRVNAGFFSYSFVSDVSKGFLTPKLMKINLEKNLTNSNLSG